MFDFYYLHIIFVGKVLLFYAPLQHLFLAALPMIDEESSISDEQLYKVERILDVKEQNGRKYYLIKWQDWDVKTCTWEDEENISHLKPLIKEFIQSRKFDQQYDGGLKKLNIVSAGMSPYEETKIYGHVLYGDEPERILEVTVIEKNNTKVVHFLVEWKEREDHYQPFKSLIESKILNEFYPQFVVSFYQSKIKLVVQP